MDRVVKTVKARTANSSYDILIGNSILPQIKNINDVLIKDRFAVIISRRVMELYGDLIRKTLYSYSNYDIFIMNDGEHNKNYRYTEEFLDSMLKNGFTRKSAVIAIGGGVVGDFAGFIASVFMRGLFFIQIPTTLLSMVDSSMGGKVAVNLSAGKNIAGAFHQPGMVISDICFLNTLPDQELKNGLTEALKHSIIGEKRLLPVFENNDLKSIKNPENIEDIVYYSAMFKTGIVEQDENESGIRAILNFGHTAGHAIESLMEFKGISHGEAVAVGMKIEMEISRRMGLLSSEENDHVNTLISKYNLVYNDYALNPEEIINHMKYDKKNYSGKIRFVLLKGLNNPVYNQEVDDIILRDVIKDYK